MSDPPHKHCSSVTNSIRDDKWCSKNCNSTPPNCPAKKCCCKNSNPKCPPKCLGLNYICKRATAKPVPHGCCDELKCKPVTVPGPLGLYTCQIPKEQGPTPAPARKSLIPMRRKW